MLMRQVTVQQQVEYDEEKGCFYVDTSIDHRADVVFRLGQTLTRIYDLTFLNRSHVASTFYDDLQEQIKALVPEEKIHRDYHVPGIPDAQNYPVDFYIETRKSKPLYLYGMPNRDKARLTTIFLQYLLQQGAQFDSLLVFQDQQEIPQQMRNML